MFHPEYVHLYALQSGGSGNKAGDGKHRLNVAHGKAVTYVARHRERFDTLDGQSCGSSGVLVNSRSSASVCKYPFHMQCVWPCKILYHICCNGV